MSIANQGFPAFREDLNNALPALASNNAGATEPSTMFAHQWWVDTSANPSVLKQRNADNDAWVTIGAINQTGDTFNLAVAQGGTGLANLTANNVLLGNGTSALQAVAPSTSGNVLTSNGTTWQSQAAGASFTDLSYTGTLTGGTGVANLGSGQFYKDAAGNVAIGSTNTDPFALAREKSLLISTAAANAALIINGGSAARIDFGVNGTRLGGIYQDTANFMEISTVTSLPIRFASAGSALALMTPAGLMQFNSGFGSVATAYGCRAWVNFNGTSTVAIRASGNVSSITDNGTGDYTVNFTTAMPDTNYVAFGQTRRTPFSTGAGGRLVQFPTISSTSSLNTRSGNSDGAFGSLDEDEIFVTVFR
jgi:hypothetical protein